MMKASVIGSEGYLGSHLVNELLSKGFEVHRFDIFPEKRPPFSAPYLQLDITNRVSVASRLDTDADYILMFAGISGTLDSFDRYQDFSRVNQLGLLNVLDHLRETGSDAKLVFPSTRLVYRGSGSPLTESAPKEAKTLYAASKLHAEYSLEAYGKAFDIDYTIFRICVPYGNDLSSRISYGTLGFFLDAAYANKPIPIYGDGALRRTFTHVSDIAALIVMAMQHSSTSQRALNIGGDTMELRQVANLIADRFQTTVDHVDWPPLALRIESGDTVFDDSALRQIIPYEYQHTIAEWIQGLPGK